MPNARLRDLAEVLADLPEIVAFDPSQDEQTTADDLFLCALGFEPRCTEIPWRLRQAGYKSRRAVYIEYPTNREDNAVNLPKLESYLREMSTVIRSLGADSIVSTDTLRTMLEETVGEDADRQPAVTFDISVVSNRALLRYLSVLMESNARLRIVYSEANIYHPTQEEYRSHRRRWKNDEGYGLERGVADVAPSPEFPGVHWDPMPNCVVVFPSFKPTRSRAVINFVDPSLLTRPAGMVKWLLGVPHLECDRWRLDAMREINDIEPDAPQYEVSTFDYKETIRILESLFGEVWDRHNISIAPFGSKMQALGTCLFCYIHPEVRIVFASPREYEATLYSEGCKAMWKIDFGSIRRLRRLLESVGELVVEDQSGQVHGRLANVGR